MTSEAALPVPQVLQDEQPTAVEAKPETGPPPKAVANLLAESADSPSRGVMERSQSTAIRAAEREDLKEAARQTSNIILDLGLDGLIRWVSPAWAEVVGTDSEAVQGKPISEILLDEDKEIFTRAVEKIKSDDSKSQTVRFTVQLGPDSKFYPQEEDETEASEGAEDAEAPTDGILELEGQGIIVYDRPTGSESHTMWMIRPVPEHVHVEIELPPMFAETLGGGIDILVQYLKTVADVSLGDPQRCPPPPPVLCRICERQFPPWFFEKHTELCLQEHRAEMEIQLCQENLMEHRAAIVKVLDALEARQSRPMSGDFLPPVRTQAEYKGVPIGQTSTPSSGTVSPQSGRSREPSLSGTGHARGRSFAVRRPHARIVELVLDLCDTAIEISLPTLKEPLLSRGGELRSQSPQSESRINQVMQWQSPTTSTVEQEQGLALLCADTWEASRTKVEAIFRHRNVIEYAERIRIEIASQVQDTIEFSLRKARKLAEGDLSDSSDEGATTAGEEGFFPASFDGQSAMTMALRSTSDPSLLSLERRASSPAGSARSSSSKECPTPRSRHSIKVLSQSLSRSSLHFDSEGGESDSSLVSSSFVSSGAPRTDSPLSEQDMTRPTRERKRSSLVVSGTRSPMRQKSPMRMSSASPLRIQKPRLQGFESMPSPITSPVLVAGDLTSPALENYHHRRQSSVTSDARPPISPRLYPVNSAPQRAQPPSIKDFEIIKPISKGAFGSVYLSKKKSTGDYYAIKVLKKADMISKNQVTNVKAERAIMMWQAESDFVAKLFWTFASKEFLYLVMEYLNGGDCAALIKSLGVLPEDWAKKYVAEVVLGVEHLHAKSIVHRDLKPDNLLIDSRGHLKLTDFGLSRMGLLGRQKRALNANASEATPPDLLKQGPFVRAVSGQSSRSASFDYQGNSSPVSTPQLFADAGSQLSSPAYFNLNRESSLPRDISAHSDRRKSMHRPEPNMENITSMVNSFHLSDPSASGIVTQRRSTLVDEDAMSEVSSTSDLAPLSQSVSQLSATSVPSAMLPPPMALFDPGDNARRFVGTPDYLAPETIDGTGQDEMCDWWSLGCILFEFLYGYPPFHADSPREIFERILARKISWPDDETEYEVSAEAKDLINRLLTLDPRERIGANPDDKFASGADEIKHHPFFTEIKWDTLLEDQALFVPAPENPEDTEYFDSRGATLQTFTEEFEDQLHSPNRIGTNNDSQERPYDALSKVRKEVNSIKRGLMPLHIPPHVRDTRNRRLSEPVQTDDFGNFAFKNLPVLEKANKDVIQKLRAEALGKANASATNPLPSPSVESSPLQPPLRRQVSGAKNNRRSVSPGAIAQATPSPGSRQSQPSSPLLLSFSGQNERRKGSSTSSSVSHQSGNSLQPPANFFDMPRLASAPKDSAASSAASSPIKNSKSQPAQLSPRKSHHRQVSIPAARVRSSTVGSQDGESVLREISKHQARRSGVFDVSPSSSDNEDARVGALLRVQRRRQSSRRMSQIIGLDGPFFRPLDVLICEDHPVSRMVMEKLLEKLRCRTMTVDNGSEAMRVATSAVKFDIILTEFKLPQINGEDVARMVRDTVNTNSRTPIVAVTGYLKDIKAPQHFDGVIEKPPTTEKLIDALSRLCQWRPPPNDGSVPVQPVALTPSGLRQSIISNEDSPNSVSSFPTIPSQTYHHSSREDSIGSSFFGDDSPAGDVNVIISPQTTEDWDHGLGITQDGFDESENFKALPALVHQESAPPVLPSPKQGYRPGDRFKSKRKSTEIKRQENSESGDDEDEELGHHVRIKSPVGMPRKNRNSKLGIEMMRTNSRGSVVSGPSDKANSPPGSVCDPDDDTVRLAEEIAGHSLDDPSSQLLTEAAAAAAAARKPQNSLATPHIPPPSSSLGGISPKSPPEGGLSPKSKYPEIMEPFVPTESEKQIQPVIGTLNLGDVAGLEARLDIKGLNVPPIVVESDMTDSAVSESSDKENADTSNQEISSEDVKGDKSLQKTPPPVHTDPSPHTPNKDMDVTPRPSMLQQAEAAISEEATPRASSQVRPSETT